MFTKGFRRFRKTKSLVGYLCMSTAVFSLSARAETNSTLVNSLDALLPA